MRGAGPRREREVGVVHPVDAGGALPALVRRRRLDLGLTQKQAAQRAGVALGTWAAVERAGPDAAFLDLTLWRVARALDLPVEAVMAAAGRPVEQTTAVATGSRALSADAGATVDRLAARLRDLAERSPGDAVLVCAVAEALLDRVSR